jgi:hypothetical protein
VAVDTASEPRLVVADLLDSGHLTFEEVQSRHFTIEERQARNALLVIRTTRRTLALKVYTAPGACSREVTALRHLARQARSFDVPRCTRIDDCAFLGETAPALKQVGANPRHPGISARAARRIANAVASLHRILPVAGLERAHPVISPVGVGPWILDAPAPVRELLVLLQEPEISDAIGQLDAELTDDAAVMVHGDLRPANILLERTGRVWLIDWETAGAGSRWRDLGALLAAVVEIAVSEGRGPPDSRVPRALLGEYATATDHRVDHSLVVRSAGLRLLQAAVERAHHETVSSDQGRALFVAGRLFLLRPVEGARHLGLVG